MTETSKVDANRLWYRLLRLQARMNVAIGARLKMLDLSIPQCDVLTTLTEREGVSQQELAARLYVTKGNISGLVDRLVAARLVERRALQNDRRFHSIYLTAEGRQLAHLAIETQREFVADTLGRLTAEQIAEFDTLVGLGRDIMRKQMTTPVRKRSGPVASGARR